MNAGTMGKVPGAAGFTETASKDSGGAVWVGSDEAGWGVWLWRLAKVHAASSSAVAVMFVLVIPFSALLQRGRAISVRVSALLFRDLILGEFALLQRVGREGGTGGFSILHRWLASGFEWGVTQWTTRHDGTVG